MRLTAVLFKGVLPTNLRRFPKSSFRRPMQGRYTNRKKEPKIWDTTMGELDEERVDEIGRTVPDRDRVPTIMVPDLKNFALKPYVSYRIEDTYEPPIHSKDLFEMFYAPNIEAEARGVPLERIPNPKDKPSILNRVKNVFQSKKKES